MRRARKVVYWHAMRRVWIVVAGGVLLATGWSQNLDSVIADPQHFHLEFQNQWVRIIREKMGPRESVPRHQHPEPGRVVVFLTIRISSRCRKIARPR